MNDQLLERSTPGTGTVSKTGWSNSELFMDFLSNHFKKFVPGNGHVMVLLDGHKSHVAFVRENENVSEREEVVSDEDNVGVVSEGEIGLEVGRSGVSYREEVVSDEDNVGVVSEGEIGLEVGRSGVSYREEVMSDEENVGVVSEREVGLEVGRSGVSYREEVEND
ncbi:unnamed protein product [Mytilus edulis]|uniref:DDE-1 domain-containing protein n=1 Tax=Mytilus edulis TaxID=6550 RepID=A0A8S3T4X5_MYTED|nr:unnamed protein product [Mytilus edulis]